MPNESLHEEFVPHSGKHSVVLIRHIEHYLYTETVILTTCEVEYSEATEKRSS